MFDMFFILFFFSTTFCQQGVVWNITGPKTQISEFLAANSGTMISSETQNVLN